MHFLQEILNSRYGTMNHMILSRWNCTLPSCAERTLRLDLQLFLYHRRRIHKMNDIWLQSNAATTIIRPHIEHNKIRSTWDVGNEKSEGMVDSVGGRFSLVTLEKCCRSITNMFDAHYSYLLSLYSVAYRVAFQKGFPKRETYNVPKSASVIY